MNQLTGIDFGGPDQTYLMQCENKPMIPIITLEPAVQTALRDIKQPICVAIEGTYNRWGPKVVVRFIAKAVS